MGAARLRRGVAAAACLVLAVALALGGAPATAQDASGASVNADFHTLRTPPLADGQFELLTLSTLPDMVTGGDVLVAVRGLAADAEVTLTADGRDVTDVLEVLDGGERRGLVTGLEIGPNTLVARSGDLAATLVVRNHPVTGPVISGPHQVPFACRTEESGLGAPLDDNCSATPQVEWFYRTALEGFQPLSDPSDPYPDDTITTETSSGEAVPYVVRVESRTINRGIARISVLDDPAGRDDPLAFDGSLFNRRVYHVFGESCGVGYHQGTNDPTYVLGDTDLSQVSADRLLINLVGINDRLGKGDAIVHSTLAAYGVHCNPFISLETTAMIKEHISEKYGLVEAVVGTNGSGAALQQYNHINAAPGLLAAGLPTASFTDIPSTAMTVTDCGLLQAYYGRSDLDWDDQKKSSVNGHNLLSGNQLNAICQSWVDAFLDRIDPESGCSVPDEDRYDAEANPDGARCTIQDANVNLFGIDPATGFAHRPLDNVGVQYGLQAFLDGVISAEEFVDLNVQIGGYDIDGNIVGQRHAMTPEVAALTYRVGGVIGRGALDETPVLDLAPYLDLIPVANIHESVRPFQVRARLRDQTGQDDTQAIWRGVVTQADAYPVMEEWLDATLASRPDHGGDHAAAVAAARPASAADRCTFGTIGGRLELPDAILAPLGLAQLPLLPGAPVPDTDVPLRVDVPEDFDSGLGPCSLALPVVQTPRMVAGMPLSDDVLKCQLRPLDRADYPNALTDEQFAAMQAAFPDGVCDYEQRGVGDVEQSMIWPSIGTEPGSEPVELRWRVARAVAAAGTGETAPAPAPDPADDAGDGAGGPLPATGPVLPVLVLALAGLGGALALRPRTPVR